MTAAFDLTVETRGGVCDLGRVVGVLALLDLTPETLTAAPCGSGLHIAATLRADDRVRSLCVERLRAFSAVACAEARVVGLSALP